MSEQNRGEIPANVMADASPAESAAPVESVSTAAKKPVVKKAPAKAAAKPAVKADAQETHIADKIKAFPRRRVWPD
ncbi:hypothetical protein THMIRHAS_24330 [Thiosulfatimonas sediminis]|uniref:Uncharacterized protein n=1 Tax=Thiosulfatimonas sediminis TaxID=2675054 RepID=A0A6F8PS22_9GAMM|nr:hypothetical protein [Thiosulfatimonas sediminis]BBP44932.1 hypothetical protein THMIRHAS_03050 [Thiosulfatimonas sediminis]BBP47060.1 hypothetical protein THMIRHAS_24330 [Thiosulfatimonas sediminis]